ncbi:hypothetical protein DBV15_05655 [Temnothorax longispinosus]|uniref:Uncharacterized protein n=1 Tax=Temnothorax longispinosus TaxID=300112 RepID=A0A4S2JSG2_9HYME|nr:hypothetical protein DBV15_05655 [Temnothorax longispinosus]
MDLEVSRVYGAQDKRAVPEMFAEPSQPFGTVDLLIFVIYLMVEQLDGGIGQCLERLADVGTSNLNLRLKSFHISCFLIIFELLNVLELMMNELGSCFSSTLYKRIEYFSPPLGGIFFVSGLPFPSSFIERLVCSGRAGSSVTSTLERHCGRTTRSQQFICYSALDLALLMAMISGSFIRTCEVSELFKSVYLDREI